LLLADDDDGVRALLGSVLRAVDGVAVVLEARDGAEALELASERVFDVAVLDLNMPRVDGIEAAGALRSLQPSLLIALHSSDPELLRRRAAGLELPLFDKVELDGLVDWVERAAREGRAVGGRTAAVASMPPNADLCCARCGYGIVRRTAPGHCPMCGGESDWAEPSAWASRRASLHQRLAS
jgi:two-component system response regulator DesR